MMRIKCAFLCLLVGWFSSCHSGKRSENVDGVDSLQCYVNPISTGFLGCHVLFHHGMYYCIQGWMSGIYLRAAEDATLRQGERIQECVEFCRSFCRKHR